MLIYVYVYVYICIYIFVHTPCIRRYRTISFMRIGALGIFTYISSMTRQKAKQTKNGGGDIYHYHQACVGIRRSHPRMPIISVVFLGVIVSSYTLIRRGYRVVNVGESHEITFLSAQTHDIMQERLYL